LLSGLAVAGAHEFTFGVLGDVDLTPVFVGGFFEV
jgi:hypothetical protein